MSPWLRRGVLWALAGSAALVAVWAGIWPESFYNSFPGLGRVWVRPEGPYSEHLIRDLGSLSAALAVVTVAAAIRPAAAGWDRALAVAWLVYGVPHLAFHASHRSSLALLDQCISLAALTAQVALATLLLLPPKAREATSGLVWSHAVRPPRGVQPDR